MIAAFLMLGAVLAAPDASFAPRLETLSFYVERLEAIPVGQELADEKTARIKGLREKVAAGAADGAAFNALYMDIDVVRQWLLANTVEKPSRAPGAFSESAEGWKTESPGLTLEISAKDLAMTVRTAAGGEWKFFPSDDKDLEIGGKKVVLADAKEKKAAEFFTGYSAGMMLTLSGYEAAPGLEIRITHGLSGGEMVVDIAAKDTGAEAGILEWPKAVETGNTAADLAVIPRMQGMLLPGDWPGAITAADLCNSRSLYMPWWGQIRDGHGVQAILETSSDGGASYRHLKGGPTRIAPRWFPTLGRFGHLRTIRYVFSENATYVTMAKRYRRHVIERGDFVSLREKLARTPGLAEVIGRPVVHVGALYHFVPEASLFNKEKIENNHALTTFDQIRESLEGLHAKGLGSAYVHLDGWGFHGYDNAHPDVMPAGAEQGGVEGLRKLADTCAAMNYFFAVHDQYRDFYYNAASFDDRLTVTRLDGSREEHSTWCGGPQTIISPRFSPGYVRRNHDWFAANGVKVRGAYLDVFSVVPLEESAQPGHPMTRAECAEHRRDCFDLLRARGYVVSSEEPTDYLAGSIDLVHHGPYPTLPNIGGGDACGIPVPLFNLVYHDSLLTPWDMGEDGGWGIPNGDAGRVHCLLNAGLPYIGPGADEATVARVKEAAALAERCAFSEMTNHEFLDASMRKQRSTFADGTTVTVDFAAKTAEVSPPVK